MTFFNASEQYILQILVSAIFGTLYRKQRERRPDLLKTHTSRIPLKNKSLPNSKLDNAPAGPLSSPTSESNFLLVFWCFGFCLGLFSGVFLWL